MAVVRSALPDTANVLIEDFDASPPFKAPAPEVSEAAGFTRRLVEQTARLQALCALRIVEGRTDAAARDCDCSVA